MIHLDEIYQLIKKIDEGDGFSSVVEQEKALEILADKEIEVAFRQMIADNLNRINLRVALNNAVADDSY